MATAVQPTDFQNFSTHHPPFLSRFDPALPVPAITKATDLSRSFTLSPRHFGSSEVRVSIDSRPTYYLARPWGFHKPSICLHRGPNSSGPIVACARTSGYKLGLEVFYGDGSSNVSNSESEPTWHPYVGSLTDWTGNQRFSLHGREFIWARVREGHVAGEKTALNTIALQDAITGDVFATLERRSGIGPGTRGTLRMREGLGDEAEVMIVLTGLSWEEGRVLMRVTGAEMGAGAFGEATGGDTAKD